MTTSNTLMVNTNPRTNTTSITGRMIGSVTRVSRCQAPAPSILAASTISVGTSCSALYSSTVKNGTPIQMLVISTVRYAHPGDTSNPTGWRARCKSSRTWLTAPAWSWNKNLKITPGTSSGSSHGTRISDRGNLRRGNTRLNSSASAKPMTNWNSRDSTVKLNVRTIALSATGSLSGVVELDSPANGAVRCEIVAGDVCSKDSTRL